MVVRCKQVRLTNKLFFEILAKACIVALVAKTGETLAYSVYSKGIKPPAKLLAFEILLGLSVFTDATDRYYDIQNSSNSSIAVFVHGFTGDYIKTWEDISRLLRKDETLDNYNFLF